jgi:1,4-alpha-glucan branching enzyme
LDFEPGGFEWMDCTDYEQSVLSFLRKGKSDADSLLVICNFTPVMRPDYRVGLSSGGRWTEVLNSDRKEYGGSGQVNPHSLDAEPVPFHGREYSLSLALPSLGVLVLRKTDGGQ